jgi:hypothetical protein
MLQTWVLWHELRNIVGAAMDDDPTRLLVVVFRHLLALQLLLLGLCLTLVIHGGVLCA